MIAEDQRVREAVGVEGPFLFASLTRVENVLLPLAEDVPRCSLDICRVVQGAKDALESSVVWPSLPSLHYEDFFFISLCLFLQF